MAYPAITVLMCVYNGEPYLREAIDSVLGQSFGDFELLIVDDGSTDGSVLTVTGISDPRIRLLKNEKNLGLVESRNRGIANSSGKYVAILDCDDIATKERLAKQFAFMEANPAFGMIGSWIEIIDAGGRSTGEVMQYPAEPGQIPSFLLFGNYFAQSAVFIRKSSLPEQWYRSEFPVAEDYDLWARMASVTRLWNLQEVLTSYRVHSPSATFRKAELMERCIRGVVLHQLHLLGVQPSDNEMNIHRSVARLDFRLNRDFLVDAELWLKKLCRCNENSGRYDPDNFKKVIGWYWYLVCRQSTGLGFYSWRTFENSELGRLADLGVWPQVKFLVRCAIRFHKRRRGWICLAVPS